MRHVAVLAALAVLIVPGPVSASPRIIPQPQPVPLGVLVRDAKTIHVLEVESVGVKGVSFKVTTALKGRPEEAPFGFAEIKGWGNCQGHFRAGASVLCFRRGEVATLSVRGRWVLAVEPIAWRGEKHWFCLSADECDVTYEGPTESLRDHVVAILAGRERTITARPLRPWGVSSRGRLWRIKAGLKVTRFVKSDESAHFVGWGSGDPDEALVLARALRASEIRDRVAAANDLAHLGSAARPALAALRRTLGDPDPTVALAVGRALALVNPADDVGRKAVEARLKDAEAKVRENAATTLADLGPLARPALPALLGAAKDSSAAVRAAAATAIGQVAPDSGAEGAALLVLADLLKDGAGEGSPAHAAVKALRQFGPSAWSVAPRLHRAFPALDKPNDCSGEDVVTLLARLSPPPVEFLAEVLVDQRSEYSARRAAVAHLIALGSRARLALPHLRRGWAERRATGTVQIAEAILAIDPEGAPALIAPVLLNLARRDDGEWNPGVDRENSMWLLGRCGTAGRPALAALLPTLRPDDHRSRHAVACLTPLLSPADRKLLPDLRRLLTPDKDDPLPLAEVLLRLGMSREAVDQAALGLKSPNAYTAARWLAARGREARPAEAALRQAMARATGSERTRLSLAIWRVAGMGEAGARGRALAALETLSQHGHWWDEDDFGEGLAEVHSRVLADEDTEAVLARSLDDRNPYIRLIAAGALARVKPEHPGTVPTLRHLLARHPDFFPYAEDTLAALGPRAEALGPLLAPMLRMENEGLYFAAEGRYFAAERVLRRIDPVLAANGWGAAGAPGAVPEDLTPLWDDLAGSDAFRADLAAWRLAGAGPRTVALVRERLRPPPGLTPQQLGRLIADLDSETFTTRERASAELGRCLESAAPALREARASKPSLEVRIRIDRLLARLDLPGEPEQRRRLRAVRLLTEMGCPEPRELLGRLSRDARFAHALEAAGASGEPKAKPSLADDTKALQGSWDRPPTKGADGKVTHGLRLEFRGKQLTVLVYDRAGDPRGGDHRLIERPFALKEEGGKRLVVEGLDDLPMFSYKLDDANLTVAPEKWMVRQFGKDWKVPDSNLLKKVEKK